MGYAGKRPHELKDASCYHANLSPLCGLALACFLGSIQAMAQRLGKEEMGKKAVVHANVHIGEPNHFQGFGLAVDIKVEGVDEELLKAGHEVCWYKILDEILVASCFTNNSL